MFAKWVQIYKIWEYQTAIYLIYLKNIYIEPL